MSNFPKVAVLLSAYNGRLYLAEQIESILIQEYVRIYIFISVDKSTDGTEDYLSKWAFSEPRLILLPFGMRFGGAAPNFYRLLRDVNLDGFDYASFADQDDIWLPDKLFRAHQILLNTGADAYSSNVMAFWPGGQRLLIEKSQNQVKWDFLFEAAGPGCTYVMRKELACAIQDVVRSRCDVMPEVGLHDWFVYAFARAYGYRWVIDDYAGMFYRQHEKNQVGANTGTRAFAQRALKVLNGWGVNQSALIAQLVELDDDPFVKRWSGGSRAGLLWLGFHAWQCRRRVRDKILFSLSCIAMCLVGSRHK